MLPPFGQAGAQHRFGHIDKHRHIVQRCQIRPRRLPQQQVIPLGDDNRGFGSDHPRPGAGYFDAAVKHRHRHKRLIPCAQAQQQVAKAADIKGFGCALARAQPGRHQIQIVIVKAIHRQHRRQPRRSGIQPVHQRLGHRAFPRPRGTGNGGNHPLATGGAPGQQVGQPGRINLGSGHSNPQIRRYRRALLRRNGRPRSITSSKFCASGCQTASPYPTSGGMLMKLSIASPPLKPMAASVA